MGKPTRLSSHGTFFISTQTYNRRRLFQTTANAELFLDTLQHYRREIGAPDGRSLPGGVKKATTNSTPSS
jgi:hypothetical protein